MKQLKKMIMNKKDLIMDSQIGSQVYDEINFHEKIQKVKNEIFQDLLEKLSAQIAQFVNNVTNSNQSLQTAVKGDMTLLNKQVTGEIALLKEQVSNSIDIAMTSFVNRVMQHENENTMKMTTVFQRLGVIEKDVHRSRFFIYILCGVMMILGVLYFGILSNERQMIKEEKKIEITLDSVFNRMKQSDLIDNKEEVENYVLEEEDNN